MGLHGLLQGYIYLFIPITKIEQFFLMDIKLDSNIPPLSPSLPFSPSLSLNKELQLVSNLRMFKNIIVVSGNITKKLISLLCNQPYTGSVKKHRT
jgi:hypothetical protein